MSKISLFCVVVLCLSTCAWASTWYVDDNAPSDPASGDPNISDPLEDGTVAHPFDAIQEAIDIANAGDIVLVADGTYTGVGNRDIDFLGKAITVQSENGPETCTIDCEGTEQDPHRAFIFQSGETNDAILDGLRIINGYAPTIENEWGDEVSDNGGAISCVGSSPTIKKCRFTNNTAFNISTYQGISNSSGAGGAIYFDDANIILESCLFESCHAMLGSAICLDDSVAEILNCIFAGNYSDLYGEAIFVYGSECHIIHSTFDGNLAYDSYYTKMFSEGASVCASYTEGDPLSSVGIKNCILWDETPIINHDGSSIEITYSNIKGGYSGEGNIDEDPYFVKPGYWDENGTPYDSSDDVWYSGDYHLLNQTWTRIDSGQWYGTWFYFEQNPNVDSGDPLVSLLTDYDDGLRPIDGDSNGLAIPDMGAYEFDPASVPTIVTSTDSILLEAREDHKTPTYGMSYWMWPPRAYLSIHTGNTDPLDWTIVNEPNWLDISPTSGVSFVDANGISICPDIDELDVGTYIESFEIVNTADTTQRKTINVELVIKSAELRVPDHYSTIQEAIDWAHSGETVILSDGVYAGRLNTNIELPKRDITIRSENGPANCIIDCQSNDLGSDRAFILDYAGYFGNVDVVISGLTIINGNDEYPQGGGAILCDSTSPKIENCIFENCFARDHGGAIACYNSSPIIDNCIFNHCSSEGNGGAIAFCESMPVIKNSRFYGNSAHFGSAVVSFRSPFNMENCQIVGNRAEDFGYSSYPGGNGIIRFSGGAVCYDASYNEDVVSNIRNCLFEGNYGRYCGAFLNINFGDTDMKNCTFVENSSDEQYNSSIAYVSLGDDPLSGASRFSNCIFYDNQNANGLDVFDANGYYYYYPAQFLAEDVYSIDYSCIEGLNGDLSGMGNIDSIPLFIQGGYWDENGTVGYGYDDIWIQGDYHLKSEGWRWDVSSNQWTWDDVTSPCIDAGNPGAALGEEPTTLDVDPLNRFGENIRVNMGAYGGTVEASMAPPGWMLLCDLDNSYRVDLADFVPMADAWLQAGPNQPADVTRDGTVDLEDAAAFTDQWLSTVAR